jgi:hypothetical protein
MTGDGEIEAGLRKIAMDESVPANLRLGALKELGRLRGDAPPEPRAQVRASASGLPPDPLLEEFQDAPGEDGRLLPFDPMSDLDWSQPVGRAPHRLYARALVRGRRTRARSSCSTPRRGSCASAGTAVST